MVAAGAARRWLLVTRCPGRRHLAQNPFVCDCNLKWLADFLRANPIETSGARCASPRRLANKRIGQIKSKKFRCSGERRPRPPSRSPPPPAAHAVVLMCFFSLQPRSSISSQVRGRGAGAGPGGLALLLPYFLAAGVWVLRYQKHWVLGAPIVPFPRGHRWLRVQTGSVCSTPHSQDKYPSG